MKTGTVFMCLCSRLLSLTFPFCLTPEHQLCVGLWHVHRDRDKETWPDTDTSKGSITSLIIYLINKQMRALTLYRNRTPQHFRNLAPADQETSLCDFLALDPTGIRQSRVLSAILPIMYQ
jgi:hypothetical protein